MKNRLPAIERPDDLLARRVIGLAMKVHRVLGCGFLEPVYRNALTIELRKSNLPFHVHPRLSVGYEGIEIGSFQADFIIKNQLIVELKAVDALASAHSLQLVNYLAASRIENGLLLNFGAHSLEFRTKTRSYLTHSEPPNLRA